MSDVVSAPEAPCSPSDDLDYTFDFVRWPQITHANAIASATVTATPSGLTIGSASPSADYRGITSQVSARLSGFVAGNLYTVKCVATLTNGRDITGYVRLRCGDP